MTPEAQEVRHALVGVPGYDAASESFSDIRALSAALRFLGEEADLETVLAVSGEAFRAVAHAERWSLGAAYVSPEPALAVGARAFGYQPRYLINAGAEQTWLAICDAVDAGQPALSSGIVTRRGRPLSTWWFLVRGYDSQAKTVQALGLPGEGEAFTPLPEHNGQAASWVGLVKGTELVPGLVAERPVFLLGLKGPPPGPRTMAVETVRRAAQATRDATVTVPGELADVGGRYVLGLASFQVWADRLASITGREPFFREGRPERASRSLTVANRETAERLRCGREAASAFLRRASDLFDGEVHDGLLSAATGYAEVADLAERYLRLFAGADAFEEQDLLLDRDNRGQGVLLIRQMQALEGAAAAGLAMVLTCMGGRA